MSKSWGCKAFARHRCIAIALRVQYSGLFKQREASRKNSKHEDDKTRNLLKNRENVPVTNHQQHLLVTVLFAFFWEGG